MKKHRSWISSTIFSKAFLAKAWEARAELNEYERRGFAQYFYLTVCCHLEAVLAERIRRRLHLIATSPWEAAGAVTCNIDGNEQECPLDQVIGSIRHIAHQMKKEAESAPLSKLLKLYNEVFPEKLASVIGDELYKDVDALATLRNIFAHGRELVLEFEGEDLMNLRGVLEGNPLEKVAARLVQARVIPSTEFHGSDHIEFLGRFFSDGAMLYFYQVVKSVESRIEASTTYVPERVWPEVQDLPELRA